MLATNVFHALGLHMHQPPGNLQLLIDADPWEAEQIIRCYERPTRYARRYADVAHLHIGFSGILLEQLLDPRIVDAYRHILDLPAMLAAYREADNIELIGMGYFHPIFPLIQRADWEEQLRSGRDLMQQAFGRTPRGFWPPEMAFSMEMIPALVKAGYEYVVVDGVHVRPDDGIVDVFRPYRACHDGHCITVVPRDRDVSNAQESGLDATWFAHEVTHRCRFSPRPDEPRLVTTWSDGENGGWFRQTHEGSGFFGHYFAPYMEHVRNGEYPVQPVALSAFLAEHAPTAMAQVQTGAWNVGSTSGFDLSQWAGSPGQQAAAETVRALSRRWWALRDAAPDGQRPDADALAAVRRLILEAETSCYLFWGDDWLPKLREITDAADAALAALESGPSPAGSAAGPAATKDAEGAAVHEAASDSRAEPGTARPATGAAAEPPAAAGPADQPVADVAAGVPGHASPKASPVATGGERDESRPVTRGKAVTRGKTTAKTAGAQTAKPAKKKAAAAAGAKAKPAKRKPTGSRSKPTE